MSRPNQFRLLSERRFLPFFVAQSLGAFNDNIFRNVLVILVTYGAIGASGVDTKVLTNLAGGVFVVPYLIFSGLAGQLADRFDKALVVKLTKASEIAIMALPSTLLITSAVERQEVRLRATSTRVFSLRIWSADTADVT